jgi:uncharacterized protein
LLNRCSIEDFRLAESRIGWHPDVVPVELLAGADVPAPHVVGMRGPAWRTLRRMADPITEADIERARVGYRKFREGDPSAFDNWDPDIEIHVPKSLPSGGDLRGVLEFREFLETMMEHLEEAYPDPEEFMAAGGKLIVLGTWHARARKTGRKLAVPFAHVYEMRDGKFNYFRNYIDSSEMLELLAESRG